MPTQNISKFVYILQNILHIVAIILVRAAQVKMYIYAVFLDDKCLLEKVL